MAAWRRRALELGSGCMCELMWRFMWQAPLVMYYVLQQSIMSKHGMSRMLLSQPNVATTISQQWN
ncbi:Uncharacterized protein APZ42_009498 [Daphnia magna]|uniref:Uncharacterized protein n=2 Tax=Daphnia magna TaxID=35525 RepID=A0A164DZB1_9CRUS|nr:hypothetical protein OUZ56_012627 [Daphnia magna]KZR96263.1 Uncharacterized protein APZ42_009498 [Daphnia magna]